MKREIVWFDCRVEISQIIACLATLLIQLKSPQLLGVRQVDFLMFPPMVEMLLNIEQILMKNSSKSKPNTIGEFGHTLGE
jgi:hypothetical protein